MPHRRERADGIVPSSAILVHLCDIEGLKNECDAEKTQFSEAVPGIALATVAILRELMNRLRDDDALGIPFDETSYRAMFRGSPPIRKLRPHSPRVCLLRRVDELVRTLASSKSEGALVSALRMVETEVATPLVSWLSDDVVVSPKFARLGKDHAVRSLAAFHVWYALHDEPLDVAVRLIEGDKWTESGSRELSRAYGETVRQYVGLKVALLHLWKKFGGPHSDEICRLVRAAPDPLALHSVNRRIHDLAIGEIVEIDRNFLLNEVLSTPARSQSTRFTTAIQRGNVQPELKSSEFIDETLLWYPFEIIDSIEEKRFMGARTLFSLIFGEVRQRRREGNRKPVTLLRVDHPGDTPWVSYALLIERSTGWGDYSGWAIFCNATCAEPGEDHDHPWMDAMVEQHAKLLAVRHLKISWAAFQKHLLNTLRDEGKDRFIPHERAPMDELRVQHNSLRESVGHLRGMLAVELAAAFVASEGFAARTEAQIGKYAVDVHGTKEATHFVVECKASLSMKRLEEAMAQVQNAAKLLPVDTRRAVVTAERDPDLFRIGRAKAAAQGIELLHVANLIARLRSARKEEYARAFGLL